MPFYTENAHNTELFCNELSLIQYDVFYQIKALYLLEEKVPTLRDHLIALRGKPGIALSLTNTSEKKTATTSMMNLKGKSLMTSVNALRRKNRKSEKCC